MASCIYCVVLCLQVNINLVLTRLNILKQNNTSVNILAAEKIILLNLFIASLEVNNFNCIVDEGVEIVIIWYLWWPWRINS